MRLYTCLLCFCCLMILPLAANGGEPFPWLMFLPKPQNPEPAFTRSNSSHIVTDTTTSLMWQDYYPQFKQSEAEASTYCEQMDLDGYEDWRFPLFSELQDFFRGVAADQDFDLLYWGSFAHCTASIAIGGYVKTPSGAVKYGGNTGDRINFPGGAAARCVR